MISLLQAADVLVAAHGDDISNVLYMQPGRLAIEIQPFGLKDTIPQRLAEARGVKLQPLESKPDTKTLRACLAASKGGLEGDTKLFLDAWKEATDSKEGYPPGDFGKVDIMGEWHDRVPAAAGCAAKQALHFNYEMVAKYSFSQVEKKCSAE